MNIAVFGSREGVDRTIVEEYLAPRFRPEVTLVSGGARGVDSFAENFWRGQGGQVLSIRPVQLADQDYGIEYWTNESVWMPQDWPTFLDYGSAAISRDMLIADHADRGVAFWHNQSRGTGHTIAFLTGLGKPCAIHEV